MLRRSDPIVSWYKFHHPWHRALVERLILWVGTNLPEVVKDVVIAERGGVQRGGITFFGGEDVQVIRTGPYDFDIINNLRLTPNQNVGELGPYAALRERS